MSDVYDEFLELEAQSGATQISMGDLTPNKPYPLCAVKVTCHPDIGRRVRAYGDHDSEYVFFTGRFRQLTDLQIAAVNNDVAAERPPPALRYTWDPTGGPSEWRLKDMIVSTSPLILKPDVT